MSGHARQKLRLRFGSLVRFLMQPPVQRAPQPPGTFGMEGA
jgi:hypothetical protein